MPVTELAEEKFVGISTQGYNSKLKSDILYDPKVGNGNQFDFFANLCTFETLFLRLHFPQRQWRTLSNIYPVIDLQQTVFFLEGHYICSITSKHNLFS